jgi:hypothetical protein
MSCNHIATLKRYDFTMSVRKTARVLPFDAKSRLNDSLFRLCASARPMKCLNKTQDDSPRGRGKFQKLLNDLSDIGTDDRLAS